MHISEINSIQWYMLLTLLLVAKYHSANKLADKLLLTILILGVVNEVASEILLAKKLTVGLNTNIYVVSSSVLWLLIFKKISNRKSVNVAIAMFLLAAILNSFLLDGFYKFNFYTFVVGAMLYVLLFLIDSARRLRSGELDYFLSNDYLLITAPVLFFIGFSLIFGFRRSINGSISFFGIQLYDYISYFVNIVFYTLVNIYIIRQKNRNHGC